jgi:hypothetical protein
MAKRSRKRSEIDKPRRPLASSKNSQVKSHQTRSQPMAVSLSAGLVVDRFSPNNMNLTCFPPAFAGRFFALPYRSKWERSGLRQPFSSSRKRCTCNWSSFQPCSTLQKDVQELGKPRLTQPRHWGLSNKANRPVVTPHPHSHQRHARDEADDGRDVEKTPKHWGLCG